MLRIEPVLAMSKANILLSALTPQVFIYKSYTQFITGYSVRSQSQGLIHAQQVLYHLSYFLDSHSFFFFKYATCGGWER